MRVVLLVETLAIGGLPNHVLDLARALSDAGECVAVAHAGTDVPTHLDTRGIELLALADVGAPLDAPRALARLRQWQPDLVHVHLCSHLELLLALSELRVPLVRSFHDYTSLCLRRGRRRYPGDRCARALGWSCALYGCLLGAPEPGQRLPRLANLPRKLSERARYQHFDAALVGSNHMGEVLRINGFAPERITVVPYFSRFDREARGLAEMPEKPAGIPGVTRPLALMFAGQAVAGKGLEVLVRALPAMRGDWRLTAITSGPELERVRALARQLGVDARIEFIEWLPHEALAGHYRRADLFVLPSVWDDPGPLVGIEAMSFATPVVAFAVGGIPDYVLHGRTGFLVAEVSVEALGGQLQRALECGAGLAELGRAGQALVVDRHGRSRHVNTIRSMYGHAAAARAMGLEAVT